MDTLLTNILHIPGIYVIAIIKQFYPLEILFYQIEEIIYYKPFIFNIFKCM